MSKKTIFVSPGVSTREGMETYYPNLTSEFTEMINMMSQFPNDQDLGKEIRKYLNNKINKNEHV
jgi:hypothetical protein